MYFFAFFLTRLFSINHKDTKGHRESKIPTPSVLSVPSVVKFTGF